MDKLDLMIEEALTDEDRDILAATDEQGFFTQMFGQYRGRNGWVALLSSLAILAYAVLLFWAGWKTFAATDTLLALKWGLVAVASVAVIGMLKLYLLSAMQTDRVIRELKRVELMLAAQGGK